MFGIGKIIEIAVLLTLLASSTGQLPRAIRYLQVAQAQLLAKSTTSTWGKLMIMKK